VKNLMMTEDEIMAAYLLKGGKMLSKSCSTCGCPLFEYKGETLCVVCKESENDEGNKEKISSPASKPEKSSPDAGRKDTGELKGSMENMLAVLCERIRNEPDPGRVLVLMNSVKKGIEAYNLLP
jgi:UPF0148 protein